MGDGQLEEREWIWTAKVWLVKRSPRGFDIYEIVGCITSGVNLPSLKLSGARNPIFVKTWSIFWGLISFRIFLLMFYGFVSCALC